MIEHLDNLPAESLQNYPFCVIGSGAAGISVAVALSRKGHRVLLVESGDWNEAPEQADAYSGEAESPHPPTTDFRRQRFGGTTHLWGGRCVPLDPLDFKKRAHVPNSGWPIDSEEMAAYIPQAMEYCDAGIANFSISALAGNGGPLFADLPGLAPDLIERIERYSLPTDFAKKFRAELMGSRLVQVVLRARCIHLGLSRNGSRIEKARLTDGKRQTEVRAGNFILCMGGIEVPRLLLCTRAEVPEWSRFDMCLGKYYACHFDLIFGELRFSSGRPYFEFEKTSDGIYARRKLQFSEGFQSKHSLLNSAFRLHFPPYADPDHGSGVLSTIYLAKSVLASEYQTILNHGQGQSVKDPSARAHIRNIATDFGSILSFGYDWLFKRKLATRKLPYTLVANRNGSYPIEFNSEQIPDAANRIELLDSRDSAGLRRVSIHWKLNPSDVQSGIESLTQLKRLLATTANCRLEFDGKELENRAAAALPIGGHHIGATRMGRSPQNSVVDRNCRLHGVENLFVASASVFPTSSHANPTLTIVALALRLAAHLNQEANKMAHLGEIQPVATPVNSVRAMPPR